MRREIHDIINGDDPNHLIPYYLMSCYLYYVEDSPAITDSEFDELSKKVLERWDEITHYHKDLITKEDLEAGTGYAIQYPLIVQSSARDWFRS